MRLTSISAIKRHRSEVAQPSNGRHFPRRQVSLTNHFPQAEIVLGVLERGIPRPLSHPSEGGTAATRGQPEKLADVANFATHSIRAWEASSEETQTQGTRRKRRRSIE